MLCGYISYPRKIFDELPKPSVFLYMYPVVIKACSEPKFLQLTIEELFCEGFMRESELTSPNAIYEDSFEINNGFSLDFRS